MNSMAAVPFIEPETCFYLSESVYFVHLPISPLPTAYPTSAFWSLLLTFCISCFHSRTRLYYHCISDIFSLVWCPSGSSIVSSCPCFHGLSYKPMCIYRQHFLYSFICWQRLVSKLWSLNIAAVDMGCRHCWDILILFPFWYLPRRGLFDLWPNLIYGFS